jgi:predicted naringenin-chalcone synthase
MDFNLCGQKMIKWTHELLQKLGKAQNITIFHFFTGLVTRKSVGGSRLIQVMGPGITKILPKVLFQSKA